MPKIKMFANKYNLITSYKDKNVCFLADSSIGTMGDKDANTGYLGLRVLHTTSYGNDISISLIKYNGVNYFDYPKPLNIAFKTAAKLAISKKVDEESKVMNLYTYTYEPGAQLGIALGTTAVLLWFKDQVNHGADWDIKVRSPWEKTVIVPYPGSYDTKIIFNGEITSPEELGNIFYGYTGTAMGIIEDTLMIGSTYAAGELFDLKPDSENEANDKVIIKKGIDMFINDKNGGLYE